MVRDLQETDASVAPASVIDAGTNGLALFAPTASWRMRLAELRQAIHAGTYHVSASDLADALLRSFRNSN
ncbi:MAG TPA: flagellar biosynthesis anti-sigma factor FlgM [Candidatus Aquilonibacter sp.]|nr:flagellar biosynthesis anti-sigma factor FlgM [Candidatus Aquilonibacter sp.]